MAEIQQMTGFQSACAEYAEDKLSLDEEFLTKNPSRFPIRIRTGSKFFPEFTKGDRLYVDRAMHPQHGNFVVAVIANEFKIAQFVLAPDGTPWLMPFQKKVGDVEAEEDFIWGVIVSLHRTYRK